MELLLIPLYILVFPAMALGVCYLGIIVLSTPYYAIRGIYRDVKSKVGKYE